MQLGDTSLANMTAVPPSAFTSDDVRLRVWFKDGSTGSQLLIPDQRVAAVGYAMLASTVPDGAITTPTIAAGAVGSAQIAAGAVGATQIAAGAVGGAQLAAGSVGATQLAAGAVGAAQLATGSIGIAQFAKPPQAGVSLVDPLEGTLHTVTFPQAYSAAPVVTITAGFSSATSSRTAALVSSTATGFTAEVHALFEGLPVGSPAVVYNDPSLLIIGGNPVIAYADIDTGSLMLIRATNPAGTAWAAPTTAAMGGGIDGLALQVVNGRPAIFYSQSEGGPSQVKYVRATDADGTAFGAAVVVGVGYAPSLQIVNGNPAIGYMTGNAAHPAYVRATNADGTAWGAPVFPVSAAELIDSTSLQVVNGRPARAIRAAAASPVRCSPRPAAAPSRSPPRR